MRLSVLVNEVRPSWSPWDPFLRGTEEFVRETASQAAAMGHKVTVYASLSRNGTCGGATYLPRGAFRPGDTTVLVKELNPIASSPLPGRTIYWTNETDAASRLTPDILGRLDKVVAISRWQREHLLAGIPDVQVVPHGIYPERYRGGTKEPGLCLYASSPDRGLDLLRECWPAIQEKAPHARLATTYGGFSEEEMDDLYRRADLWLHPCTGVELYCIAGRKAQAAGCIPVYFPRMALSETVEAGLSSCPADFVADTVRALTDEVLRSEVRERLSKVQFTTHAETVAQLLS